jgi:hypothetical protein
MISPSIAQVVYLESEFGTPEADKVVRVEIPLPVIFMHQEG